MKKLRISAELSLPDEAVTQTFGILAKRGVGKTYTASVLTEELLKAGLHVAVVDPIGVWWGLRTSADGKGAGLPIVILGGDHADVPLEVTGGRLVADLIVDEGLSLVLDLSGFRKGDQVRFMTDFAEQLYHRNREPLHLVLDEADAFAPQKPYRGQERLLGAVEDLVRRGRARGIGVTLVTQRSAVLNKDVLTQVEVLVALRTIAPQDREAIDAWIRVHGTPEQREELMASLPSLPVGEAWFWSPGWLDIFQRVHVRERDTFDSSATPKAGTTVIRPEGSAEVDLEKLRSRMAETIERAKAEDPKELHKRIRQLEGQLQRLEQGQARTETVVETVVEKVEVPVLDAALVAQLTDVVDRLAAHGEGISQVAERLGSALREAIARVQSPGVAQRAERPAARSVPPRAVAVAETPVRVRASETSRGDDEQRALGKAERAFLVALAPYPNGRTKVQAALLAGYPPGVSTTRNTLSALRTRGLIEGMGTENEPLRITGVGLDEIGDDWEPLPTGSRLAEYWYARSGKAEGAFLRAVVESYPDGLTKEEAAARAGYDPLVSTTRNTLSRLRTLGLITGYDRMVASAELVD